MFALRSLYMRLYGLLALVVCGYALFQLSHGSLSWVAPLLAWCPLLLVNGWRRLCGNIFYGDDREKLAMTIVLVGVALALIGGERTVSLLLTLLGLFSLLVYVFIATALPRGLREKEGQRSSLKHQTFQDEEGREVTLRPLASSGPALVVFIHSCSQVYSTMVLRELNHLLESQQMPLCASQCVVVFPGPVPRQANDLTTQGVHCWSDAGGDSLSHLGLWLRGGNWLFLGGSHAARPAIAMVSQEKDAPLFWSEGINLRVPPSIAAHLEKIKKVCVS